MVKYISGFILAFTLLMNANAQSFFEDAPEKPSFEAGLGVVFKHQEDFSALRFTAGAKDVLLKNRLGFYYVVEYRGGINFQEDQTDFYFRDVLGVIVSVNKSFALRAGVGMFRKGLITANGTEGRLRKQISITYQIPQYPVSVDIGYSQWVGPTATFRYVMPL